MTVARWEAGVPRLRVGGVYEDEPPRRPDAKARLVAIVLVICLLLGVAPFIAALFF